MGVSVRARDTPAPGRRLRVVAVIVAALCLVGGGSAPAAGQSSRTRLRDAQSKARGYQAELQKLAIEHSEQEHKLDAISAKISATQNAKRKAEERSARIRGELKARIRAAYRQGGLGLFGFLLTSGSFRDFSLRVMMLERQSSQDETIILEMRRLEAELASRERDLRAQKVVQAREVATLRAQASKMSASFSQLQTLVKSLEGQVRAEDLARFFRVGRGTASGRTVALQSCPALGPHAFSNDWGAPRSGGRSHRGNDIFAPHGSPAGAVVGGRISRLRSGGLGGLSVYLWGDDGNEYYYAHMSGFAASAGQRVSSGQTIAYVGNTGNARGGAAHIHFEIHPGGGGAINPYPSLIRVC